MLKIFNSFKKKKEVFRSYFSNKVNIYVCGVTVSDYCHIGHVRTFYFFDILLRYLKYLGYKCNYIRNITDIDNKIIKNSIKSNISLRKISKLMINFMNKDFKKLNFLKPNHEPKVSNNINLIIKYISKLLKNKYAYISYNGDILFSLKKIKNYGCNLLKKKIIYNSKYNFVLWKLNKKSDILGWNSPWGIGRPGWHIECSVISNKYLFSKIDIHGGGSDLLFPHHENEIVQSKCLFKNKYFVNYWVHTGMVINCGKKLSKSKNNYFLIKDLLKIYHPDVIKYFLMSVHYRKKLNFNIEKLEKSKLLLNNMYFSLQGLNKNIILSKNDILSFNEFDDFFYKYMNDDFNIPKIYVLFFNMINEINRLKCKLNYILAGKLGIKIRFFFNLIGLLNFNNINDYFHKNYLYKNSINNKIIKKINKLIILRNIARKKNNWKLSDYIRNKLYKLNVFIKDKKNFISDWYFN